MRITTPRLRPVRDSLRGLRSSLPRSTPFTALRLAAFVLLVLAHAATLAHADGPRWVRRVSAVTATTSSTRIDIVANRTVDAGDAILVAVMLSAAATGPVSMTDTGGNTYRLVTDQSDGSDGDRLLIFASLGARLLQIYGTITMTIPRSAAYHVTVDEFQGIGAVDRTASSTGSGSSFSSGSSGTTTQSSELVFGAVGVQSGNTPSWSSGWTKLSGVSRGSDYIGAAYRITSSRNSFTASGSCGGKWMASVATFSAGSAPPPPPPTSDDPPVARLSVTQAPSPPLTVTADGSASTDADATPIASYWFDFGDGTTMTTTAPVATASHTYASPGSYTLRLTATDAGGHESSAAAAGVTENLPVSSPDAVAVYAGYYDSHHASTQPKPSPWRGSSNTVFVGQPDGGTSDKWDTSCVRVDNLGGSTLSGVVVSVDIGSHHYALWGSNSIPPGQSLVLAQTALENFDGSDTNPAGCYTCSPLDCTTRVTNTIPVVHVTVNGTRTDYYDLAQTLNTHGVDAAGCPYSGGRNDESQAWQRILSGAAMRAADRERSAAAIAVGTPVQWLASPTPNPSHGELEIRYSTGVRGDARFEVFDVGGRRVSVQDVHMLEPGEHRQRLDLRGVAAGIYFCTLQVTGVTVSQSFVLVP